MGRLELALLPLTPVYAGIVGLRRRAYAFGVLRRHRLAVPVVSVGNLSFGGSGKTPTVIALARDLIHRGRRPAVVTRGFGRAPGPPQVLVGPEVDADPLRCGDEPLEIARGLPGVPVVVDPDRVRGGRRARALGADLVLLDDGFQHLRLQRNVDLVLLPADDPWAGGRLPPRGRLRERPSALRRASAALVTGLEGLNDARLQTVQRQVEVVAPGCPVVGVTSRLVRVMSADGELEIESLRGQRVVAFAGLARPDGFRRTLQRAGAEMVGCRWFADHHHYRPEDLEVVCAEAEAAGALAVTTRKDAVKLPQDPRVWVAEIEVEPLSSWQELWSACGGVP